ncbi:MAG: conjugal transfer protein [Actinomycetia bacterium]|nr:conjugal transfer protein [Actinomycetes bacterium]
MQMSKIWQTRIARTKTQLLNVGRPAVVVLAALAGLNLVWQTFFGVPPDLTTPSRAAVNKAAVVSAFAQDFVSVWLTATSMDTANSLEQFVDVRHENLQLPSTPAVVINTPTVVAVTFEGTAGQSADVEVWSVVVGVTQRPYESASPHRALYRVPVLWSRFGPRAATFPARIGGPGAGADLPLSYPSALGEGEPAYAVAAGFLNAYLTDAGGVERFVSADSLITSVPGAYQSVTVTEISAIVAPPAVPAQGQRARVLVRATAVTSQYAPTNLVYPLTLKGVGGRWLVAAIDRAPAVSTDDELVPAAVATDWRGPTQPTN